MATDAIGMGLNLDIEHVAFAGLSKYDGVRQRRLTTAEMAQIAGRAGRHTEDGTFGVTAEADPFDNETVERLENHNFDTVRLLQWRNRDLQRCLLSGSRKADLYGRHEAQSCRAERG